MFNLTQITTYVYVISEGGMTAAANKLGLTQPAVSQQIRALEEDLGVELIVRGVREIKPTLQGQLFYDYAKRVIQLIQQAEIAVKTLNSGLSGHIRIGTLNSIGMYLLSPVVGRILKHNPELRIKLDYRDGISLIDHFNQGKIDVLVLPEVMKQYATSLKGARDRFLFKDEMWLVGPGKGVQHPNEISLDQFMAQPYVMFSDEYPHFQRDLTQKIESIRRVTSPVFESGNLGTLKRVIESGLGWGFLPSHCIRKQVKLGRMKHVHVSNFNYDMDILFYFRENLEGSSLVESTYRALEPIKF